MRILNKALVVSAFGGSALTMAACPASLDDECAKGACVAASTSSGGEGGTDAGPDATPIDPCATPTNPPDPKCLDDSTTLFVSPTGSDANPGTKAAPLQSIGAAISAANDTRKRVYICEGTFAQNLTITKSIALIGGINCAWNAKAARARIVPAKGIAVTITKAATVSLTELSIASFADAQVKSDSAIGVFVSESQSVLLKSIDVSAGPGVDGTAGTNGDDSPNYVGAAAVSGNTTGDGTGAVAPTCGTCVDTTFSAGGKGAAVSGSPDPGSAQPDVGTNNSGGTTAGVCSGGTAGARGLAAAVGATGAQAPGTAAADGWKSSLTSSKGGNGRPGQGGGGGGWEGPLGGGSGGCGGCGGTGGGAGGNGGSSIAVLAFNSEVVVEDSTLTSSKAGSGGSGGNGQDGQFRGNNGGGACPGGLGGHGAGGSGGGGGAGGHSVAIGYVGAKPTATRSTLRPGDAGALGAGGGSGAGPGNPGLAGNPGAVGSSKDLLPL